METQPARLRHEYKHLISPLDGVALIQRLCKVALPEPYHPGPYFIRSLYFDNVYDKALREKQDGCQNREKFRIRYYDKNEQFIRLEKKSKINRLCAKEQAPLTKEQTERILRGDVNWLLTTGNALHAEFFAKMRWQLLRPRVIVDYTRRAFVYKAGNVRITLDYDIRSCLNATAMFNRELPTVPADFSNPVVLEIKYDAFLPGVLQDIVQLSNTQTSSFSKYAACRLLFSDVE